MSNIFQNINEIPVRTWRWTRVNDASLNAEIPARIGEFEPVIVAGGLDINVKTTIFSDKADEKIPVEINKFINENANVSLLVKAKADTAYDKPEKIVFMLNDEQSVLVDKTVIYAEKNSKAEILLDYKSDSEKAGFRAGIVHIYAEKGADISVRLIQNLSLKDSNLCFVTAAIEEDAKVSVSLVETGSAQTIGNFNAHLNGERAELELDSLYAGGGNEEIDLNYRSVHYAKNTVTNINSVGVLAGSAKKVFRGTIDFVSGCSGADGKESEKTVLLSPTVKNYSVPLLLCTEDDVSGAHAASCGKLDESKFFYMMSRGFSERLAKEILIEADIAPHLDKIHDDEIKEEIRKRIKSLVG